MGNASPETYQYDAFISYSRQNVEFAKILEKTLESYKPLKGLRAQIKNLDIFRDEGDMTGTEYFQSVDEHLSKSAKLIVICSPEARASTYVNDEIDRFAKNRDVRDIIPIIFSGIPNNIANEDQESVKAFPESLCRIMDMPLAIDYTNVNTKKDKISRGLFESPWFTLLANIYGVSRSLIEQREKHRQRRQRRIITGITSVVILSLSILSAVAIYQRSIAVEQRNEALRTQSIFLAKQSREQVASGRTDLGIKLALEALPKDLTNPDRPHVVSAEMALLNAVTNQKFVTILDTNRGDLERVLVSPDGLRGVTLHGGLIQDFRIWNIATSELIVTHKRTDYYIVSIDISPDSKYLVVGYATVIGHAISYDGQAIPNQIHIYDLKTGKLKDRFGISGYYTAYARFGKSSEELFISSDDGFMMLEMVYDKIRKDYSKEPFYFPTESSFAKLLINIPDGKQAVDFKIYPQYSIVLLTNRYGLGVIIDTSGLSELKFIRVPADKDKIVKLRLSPDGKTILIHMRSGRLFLADGVSGVVTSEVKHAKEQIIIAVQFTDEENQFRTISQQGDISLWDINTPDKPKTETRFSPEEKELGKAIFSQGAKSAVIGYKSGGIELWSFEDNSSTTILNNRKIKLTDADFNTRLNKITIATTDNIARIWSTSQNQKDTNVLLNRQDQDISFADFSNNDQYLALGEKNGQIELRDNSNQAVLWRNENAHTKPISHLSFSHDNDLLLTSSEDGNAKVWRVKTGDLLFTLAGHKKELSFGIFSHDKRYILTCSADSSSRVWDTATGELVYDLTIPERFLDPIYNASIIHHGAFTRNGRYVITVSAGDGYEIEQPALVWDLLTGKLLHTLNHLSSIWNVSITPDDQYAITSSYDQTSVIWDIRTGKKIQTLTGHSSTVTKSATLPDMSRIITTSSDGTVRIWDFNTGFILHTLKGHKTGIIALAVDSTGQRIASGGGKGQLRLWDANLGYFITEFTDQSDLIYHARFSSNSEKILSFSFDGTVRLYTLPPTGQKLIDYASAMYQMKDGKYLTREQRIRFSLEE